MSSIDFTDNTTVVPAAWLDDVDAVVYEQTGVGKTTVASATTPDIFAVTVGRLIDYTGTATCTGFVAAVSAGSERILYCADAAVFTAGANLLIDQVGSGSSLTCVAGDILDVVAITTTQWKITKRTLGVNLTGNLRIVASGAFTGTSFKALIRNDAPTIASGFGTTPSIESYNATATFRVNVGTGGTASSGVITMPAGATTGWNCTVQALVFTANSRTIMTASTINSITLTNYTESTGAAVAWPSGTILVCTCFAY